MDAFRRWFGVRPTEEESKTDDQDTQPSVDESKDMAESDRPTEPGIPVEEMGNQAQVETPLADEDTTEVDMDITKPLDQIDAERAIAGMANNMDGRTRQLPPLEDAHQGQTGKAGVGQYSDPGQVRDNNQDSSFVMTSALTTNDDNPDFGLYIVADGMGGHEDGEKASAMTVNVVANHIFNKIILPLMANEFGGSSDSLSISDEMRLAVQKANEVISERVPDGGTTLTSVLVMDNRSFIAHVGDSRAYMIGDGEIEQITRDHSLVQRLIELDQLSPEEAQDYPQRNVLYRAVGQHDNLDVDTIFRQIPTNGYILLCSDGLWNLVPDNEILSIVEMNASDTQNACKSLVDLANERGGTDNITVVLVHVPE